MLSRGFETEIKASAKGTARRSVGSPYLSGQSREITRASQKTVKISFITGIDWEIKGI